MRLDRASGNKLTISKKATLQLDFIKEAALFGNSFFPFCCIGGVIIKKIKHFIENARLIKVANKRECITETIWQISKYTALKYFCNIKEQ